MTTPFVPRCKTTAIGSLPLTDPAAACRFILDGGIDIPFWPQLPKRGFRELMNPMYSEGLPCLRLDEPERKMWFQIGDDLASQLEDFYTKFLEEKPENFLISPQYAQGFYAFMAALKSSGRTFDCLKGHVTGPLTFALGTNAAGPGKDDLRASYYDEQLRDVVVKGLTQKALWQAEQLRPYAGRVLIFIDEPVLAGFGTSAYLSLTAADVQRDLNEMIDALHAKDVLVGVHCCGNTDWAMLEGTHVDVISFDAHEYARSVSLYPKEVQEFLGRGGALAWGVVPTNEHIVEETVDTLRKRLDDGFGLLEAKGVKRATILDHCLLTPSCGTGSLSVAETEKVFDLLVKLGRAMKNGI